MVHQQRQPKAQPADKLLAAQNVSKPIGKKMFRKNKTL
jgi:hypothetical protein